MEQHSLSFATWFWLIVPMTTVVILSLITYFTETKE
jgi:hypothetical protein